MLSVSIVVPIYNEEENVYPLSCEIIKEFKENIPDYEYEILYLLAKSPGQVFSKEQIYTQVWDSSYHGAEDNVMSLIRRLRKKIEPNPANPIYIWTVWGIGYKFNCEMKKRHLL